MPLRVVLFDVGGVLVDLGGVDALLGWMGPSATLDQLWPLWLRSPCVRAFETGRIGPAEFAAGILLELKLDIAPERFLDSFARWPTHAYPGALEMVASIPKHYQRALLSNSNVLHWPRVLDELKLRSSFEHRFSSHLIGKIKPDAEAFEHVTAALGCQPAEVLFLDDNQLNVEAARSVGMRSQRVRGMQQTRSALQEAGILPKFLHGAHPIAGI
jgi:HAD superfamily hydrolase (TIGR01509 family)